MHARARHAAGSFLVMALGAMILADRAPAASDEVAAGRELAMKLCAGCHLNPGQGEKEGPAGIPGFRAVANRPGQSRDGVVSWLRTIPPMMPKHHLSQDEMWKLAAFVMSLRIDDKAN